MEIYIYPIIIFKISRLRREGSTLLETEKNRMKEELNHDNIILRRLNKGYNQINVFVLMICFMH